MAAVGTHPRGSVDAPTKTKEKAKARVTAGTTTVRVSTETHEKLRWLPAEMGAPLQQVLDKAVEHYRRKHLFDASDRAYAALRADPQAWAEEMQERELWERASLEDLRKRLADEPPYPLSDEDLRAIEDRLRVLLEI